MFTICDIETTGFSTYDDILEVGYIRVNSKCEIQQSGTIFFYQPDFKVESPAQRIHQLTRSFLREYEGEFDKNLAALYTLVHGSVFIGKNSNRFDLPVISRFLARKAPSLDKVQESATLDLQDVLAPIYANFVGDGAKKGTLEQYANMFQLSNERIQECYKSLNVPKGRDGYHSALYDATVTYMVLKECIDRNLIKLC